MLQQTNHGTTNQFHRFHCLLRVLRFHSFAHTGTEDPGKCKSLIVFNAVPLSRPQTFGMLGTVSPDTKAAAHLLRQT